MMKNTGLLTATVLAVVIRLPLQSVSAFSPGRAHHIRLEQMRSTTLQMSNSNGDNGAIPQTPLCDLQTFLRLCNLVQSGGEAKNVIQNSQCLLNSVVETRRSKKLFPGDTVTFGDVSNLDVEAEVKKKGYVYKPKVKKVKPLPRVDADGNLEFGGRYRSEEWRAERKLKKEERKRRNQGSRGEY
jgi:ribosome-associated protein